MPPKQKKGSGKKGKGKGKGKQVPLNQEPKIDPETKEFFLIQIRDLEDRLIRYQKKCDELEVSNGQFHDKYDQMATDKKEIVAFWKKQVEQKTDEIADLNDRHIGLQQTRDNEKEAFKRQIQEQRTEYQEMKDQLTAENMLLSGKLAALEEFKVQKEELMAKFAMMEELLAKKDADHKEHLYILEKKAVIDKDRLKKEMILRVNQVAADFRKVSNKQMAETTKRTIRENVSINAQLAKMSDKTIELIQENDELKEKEKKLKQQIDMLEINEKELAKKNNSNMKVIRMVTEKCRNQESIITDFDLREQNYQELVTDANVLREQVSTTREDIKQKVKHNEIIEEKCKKLEGSYMEEVKTRTKIEEIFAQASDALKNALTSTAPDDEDLNEDKKLFNLEKRDHMLEQLLIIMNSAASLGVGPLPSDLGKQWDRSTEIVGTIPGQRKRLLEEDILVPHGVGKLPHYSLGDLGLIPRPKEVISTNMDKMKTISAISRLGALRGVLQKSVATQTVSAPKALFYADQLMGKAPDTTQHAVLRELHLKELRNPPSGSSPYPIPQKLVA